MRTVTAHLFHSVDGVVESPNLWQFDQFDAGGRTPASWAATP